MLLRTVYVISIIILSVKVVTTIQVKIIHYTKNIFQK